MSVKKELAKLQWIEIETVEIGKARINIDETKVSADQISGAIEEAGFRLVSMH